MLLGYGNNGSSLNLGDISFYANNITERMRIKADTGYVGIGTSSPTEKLHIHSSSDGFLKLSSDQDGDTRRLGVQLTANNTTSHCGMFLDSADVLSFYNMGIQRITIESNGNVGIGTSSPRTILDICGNDALVIPVGNTSQRPTIPPVGSIRYNIETDQFEGYGTPFNTSETLADGYWGTLGGVKDIDRDTYITAESSLDEDKLRFFTNNNERMIVDETGKIGIGVTDPSSVLHIKDLGGGFIFDGLDTTTFNNIKSYGHDINSGRPLKISTNVNNALYIDNSGNVGIGTSFLQGAKLEIVGDIIMSESGNSNITVVQGDFELKSNDDIYIDLHYYLYSLIQE